MPFISEVIFQPINVMKHNTKNPTIIDKVTAAEVDYVMKQLKVNRIVCANS